MKCGPGSHLTSSSWRGQAITSRAVWEQVPCRGRQGQEGPAGEFCCLRALLRGVRAQTSYLEVSCMPGFYGVSLCSEGCLPCQHPILLSSLHCALTTLSLATPTTQTPPLQDSHRDHIPISCSVSTKIHYLWESFGLEPQVSSLGETILVYDTSQWLLSGSPCSMGR